MKNVLITGATGGIGQSLVKVFHVNGYNVCATGTNVDKLSFLENKYEARFKGIQCDLSDDPLRGGRFLFLKFSLD